MESALRIQLREAIGKALDRRKKVKKVNKTGPDPILASVRWRLRKAKVWKKIQSAILNEGFAKEVAAVKNARTRAETSEQQLRLPGFEGLPRRLPVGRSSVPVRSMKVTELLAYKHRYEQRREKDQRVAETLRRLADTVAPYAEDPEITVGEALDRAQDKPGLSQDTVTVAVAAMRL